MPANCIVCDDTGFSGTDAYGERTPCRHCPRGVGASAGRDSKTLAGMIEAGCLTQAEIDAARAAVAGPIVPLPDGATDVPPLCQMVPYRPGDRLVLHVNGTLSQQAADRLRDDTRRWLGDPDAKVLVLEDGARLTVLAPDGPGPDVATVDEVADVVHEAVADRDRAWRELVRSCCCGRRCEGCRAALRAAPSRLNGRRAAPPADKPREVTDGPRAYLAALEQLDAAWRAARLGAVNADEYAAAANAIRARFGLPPPSEPLSPPGA